MTIGMNSIENLHDNTEFTSLTANVIIMKFLNLYDNRRNSLLIIVSNTSLKFIRKASDHNYELIIVSNIK
ncbi:hypothetical protein CLV98_101503 [Dyadobacter jejuensis]|uniref:Uncharacterized protein n=1 Tax=Dyadobacter jejuensis TaxID=1082580 RepID=A0A316ARU8_9BACT|nr:hypothetical protein CLV98_101503 [Dyadobacter jejuensis]